MLKPHAALAHKPSAYGVDHSRKERAALTNKHHAVRHFSGHTVHSVSTQIVPVHPVPLQAALPVAPALKKHADIFESAIAHATSHTQPKHKAVRHHSRRRKVANSLAAGAAFLIIGGFFAYLNLPQLQVRVASVQAGFGASIPNYAPTGYALQDGVKRSGGTVTLSFHSGDSQYRITQQASTWNSQTLLDDTLALRDEHQTIQKNGQTIYIYKGDGTNAAWVNGGVRYDLIGNAQLSTEDIATIAASL